LLNVEKLIEDLKDSKKIEEGAMERRHQENIEICKRLVHSFEKIIDIISKK